MDIKLGPIDDFDLRPIRDIVYEQLRKAIMDQRLKRGDHLVENTVAEKMNISRTPVREAFRQLESEGLVVHMPRRGTIVLGITRDDAVDIYNIREVLEGLVVRLACEKRNQEDIDQLHSCIRRMDQAIQEDSHDELMRLHRAFNETVLQIGRSERLTGMMQQLYEYLTSLRTISLESVERQKIALEEHLAIVKAIEESKPEEGETLARKHVRKARKAFLKNIHDEK
jgi:DNA-binding GntR family transcriptional regulator